MAYSNYIHCQVLSHHLPLDPAGRKYPMPSNVWEDTDPLHLSLIHWRLTKLKNISTEADIHQMAINYNDNKETMSVSLAILSSSVYEKFKVYNSTLFTKIRQQSILPSSPTNKRQNTIHNVAVLCINNSHLGQYQSAGWCWAIFFWSAMSVSLQLGHRNRSSANEKST